MPLRSVRSEGIEVYAGEVENAWTAGVAQRHSAGWRFCTRVEIDLLVRVSDGILVLEAKTWSGFISGSEDWPIWTQHRKGGQIETFRNPVQQNLVHVRAVERFVADSAVWVRGLVGRFPA